MSTYMYTTYQWRAVGFRIRGSQTETPNQGFSGERRSGKYSNAGDVRLYALRPFIVNNAVV